MKRIHSKGVSINPPPNITQRNDRVVDDIVRKRRCSRVIRYIYLDRGKFELCHPGEFRGPETRRMEQGATRSEGHVP